MHGNDGFALQFIGALRNINTTILDNYCYTEDVKDSRSRLFIREQRRNQFIAVLAAGGVLIAAFFLISAQAAAPTASVEPEQGTITPPANKLADSGASKDGFLLFGQTAQPSNQFMQVCGKKLCLNGKEFFVSGATAYSQMNNPAGMAALTKEAGLNAIEIVEYEYDWRKLSDSMSERTWARIDNMIAEAKKSNLHVIINFSSYGHSLQRVQQKPTNVDWQPFLSFVANRTNTKTGVQYKDDPTILMVKILGEIDAPANHVPYGGTTQEITDFYKRTLAQWKALAPKILISTGGFSHLNNPNSGIDWQTIMKDPNNAMCDIEINSYPDRNISVPNVATYCNNLGKPWFLAAWSSCYRKDQPSQGDEINYWTTDAALAAHARDMYNIAYNRNLPAPGLAIAAAGTDFWSLGNVPIDRDQICDIGTQFPQTLQAVKDNAPQN